MTRFAEYFATVSKSGVITSITEATPAHELKDNQVMLTLREYKLLHVVSNIEEAKQLLGSIEYKISQLPKEE